MGISKSGSSREQAISCSTKVDVTSRTGESVLQPVEALR